MKLSIGARLWIICGLFFAPIALLTYLFVHQATGDISFALKEVEGARYAAEIWTQFARLALPGAKDVPALPHATTYDPEFGTGDASAAFLKNGDDRVSAGKTLIGAVADGSNLTLDPDLDSFYVMDAVTVRMPGIIQSAVELREASHRAPGPKRIIAIAFAVEQLKNFAGDADGSLSSGMKNNAAGDTKHALENSAKQLRTAANAVLDLGQSLLDEKPAAQLDAAVTALIGQTDQVWAVADGELVRLLQARIDGFNSNMRGKLAIVAVSLILTMIVLALVIRSITNPLKGLTAGMRRLADGDFSTELPGLALKDEIGEIARAVETFKQKAAEKARLEADAQLRQQAKEAEAQAAVSREREAAAQAREQAAERAAQEQVRIGVEREKTSAEQAHAIQHIAAGISKLAEKDLNYRIAEPLPAAYEPLRVEFNNAIEQLELAIGQVSQSAGAVTSGAGEISDASGDLARRTADQASSLEETSAALSGISGNVVHAASGAARAAEAVQGARVDAERGAEIVKNAVQSMSRIESSSNQIRQIIGVIDEIAFQTNLLALNAGVEAARAGDAGRGFAVVASEVRALAQRSAEAAKEIKGLVSKSATEVGEGVVMVADTGKALEKISAQVVDISRFIAEIAATAKEQSASLNEVSQAVSEMDKMTQQNAAMSEQATAASQSLARESRQLLDLVSQFRATQRDDGQLRQELAAAAPHVFAKRPAATPT